MARHIFKIGQLVDYNPRKGSVPASTRGYKIVQLLPEESDGLQYRIQSETETFQRVAAERDLSRR
jgi:hypothetical protein